MDINNLMQKIVLKVEEEDYKLDIPRIKNKKEKEKILKNLKIIRDAFKHNFLKYHKKPYLDRNGKKLSDKDSIFINEHNDIDMKDIFKNNEIKKAMSILSNYRKKIMNLNRFLSPLAGITADEASKAARNRINGGYKKSNKKRKKRKNKTIRK